MQRELPAIPAQSRVWSCYAEVAPASCRQPRPRLVLAGGRDARRTAAGTAALLREWRRGWDLNNSRRCNKEVPLESIVISAQILNFRMGLAHQLARFRPLFAPHFLGNPKANPLSVLDARRTHHSHCGGGCMSFLLTLLPNSCRTKKKDGDVSKGKVESRTDI